MTTEARPDLEQRAREKADAIVAAWNERDHATSEKLSDRLTAVLLEHARELEALQRERDAYKKAKAENDERYMLERDTARRERDTALADLAAARAELDALADKLKSASSIGSVFTMGTVRATEALMAAEQQRDAAITRAETAERALAALRRRVEEAAREDTTEVATIRAATAFPEVIKSYDAASVLHVLRALDATRAAAGELRAALERIASWDDNALTGSDRRTFDFWKETVRELGLIARNALKEPTP